MSAQQPASAAFPFDYKITRSRRKTLAIHVRQGEVDVRAPLNAPTDWVESFVREKTHWINRQLAEQRRQMRQRLVIADNQPVCFFGQPRTVQVVLAGQPRVEVNRDHLYIFTRHNTPEKLEQIFHRWLLEQAREYMTTQTIKTARELGVDDRLKEVAFRRTRSKWGHCCRDGTIQYNWLTMMAPRPVVDYLIAHETSHLLHMNHSQKFWRTVASVCPDYQELRDWLKHHGHRLWTQ